MVIFSMLINIAMVVWVFAINADAAWLDRSRSMKAIGYAAKAISPENGGALSGKSSIIAALSKLLDGKRGEAQKGLYDAVATMTNFVLQDRFLYMIGQDAIDFISTKKEFKQTREAIANYNYAMLSAIFKEPGDRSKRDILKDMDKAMFHIPKAFSDELFKLSSTSLAMKHLKKLNTWVRRRDLVHLLEFAFDVIALRTNLKLLKEAIKEHEDEKIVASCLGICAGMIGLKNFVSAITSQIQILDVKGPVVDGILNLAMTLVKIHENRKMQTKEQLSNATYMSQSLIEALGESSKRQLDKITSHISNQELILNDIYIANKGVIPKWGLINEKDKRPLEFGAFGNEGAGNSPLYRKEDSSDLFLVAGRARRITKAEQPKGDRETNIIGFDFYGTFAKGYPYKGSTIIVSTDGIHTPDYRLNGFRINTCLQKPWFHPNDHLLLTDMSNLDRGEHIEVHMGKGDDVLIINGMFGEFTNESVKNESILDIDLGTGLNTLSFEGMNKKRKDIKGVFFDRKDNKISYFHGTSAKLHTIGTIKFVHVLLGSPFHDYIILSGYSDGNPNGNDFTVVEHYGANFYEVDIDQRIDSKFRVIDNSKETPTIVIRTSSNIKRNELVFSGNLFRIYRKRPQDGQAKVIVHIHIISRNIPIIKVVDANDNSLIGDIKANFLAPEYVAGLSMVTKGRTTVNGSKLDDVCVLECRTADAAMNTSLVVVDLREGRDAIVIKDSTFLGPCDINDKDFNVWLQPRQDEGTNDEWYIVIEDKTTRKEVRRYLLKGVEKIINAFGSMIVDLLHKKKDKVDLLDTFISVTTHETGLFH